MTAFKTRFIVDIYSLALQGCNDRAIGKYLGVSPAGFCGWKKTKKMVRYALWKAHKDRNQSKAINWNEYVRGRLPKKLRRVWDEITAFEREDNGYSKIRLLLDGKSKRVRQHLFICSLLSCGFNVSKALRKVGMSRTTLDIWVEKDHEFVELVREVELTKKDFFEEGLVNLVKQGDSPATIFANRTMNKDRGYGERLEIDNSLTIGVKPISISELDLPLEVQRMILDAIKQQQQMKHVESETVETKRLTG